MMPVCAFAFMLGQCSAWKLLCFWKMNVLYLGIHLGKLRFFLHFSFSLFCPLHPCPSFSRVFSSGKDTLAVSCCVAHEYKQMVLTLHIKVYTIFWGI